MKIQIPFHSLLVVSRFSVHSMKSKLTKSCMGVGQSRMLFMIQHLRGLVYLLTLISGYLPRAR
jgi:hypothetical protein